MKQKYIWILLVSLICLTIASFIVFSMAQTSQKVIGETTGLNSSTGKPVKSLFSIQNKPTPTPIWTTYVSQRLNYEIKYPSEWNKDDWNIQDAVNVKSTADGNIWGQTRLYDNKDKRLEIIAWGNSTKTPILQWLQWYRHEDLNLSALPKELNYNFQNRPALRFVHENTSFTYPVVHIIIQERDKLYEILYRMDSLRGIQQPTDSQLIDSPYDEMLQSFKFTP